MNAKLSLMRALTTQGRALVEAGESNPQPPSMNQWVTGVSGEEWKSGRVDEWTSVLGVP